MGELRTMGGIDDGGWVGGEGGGHVDHDRDHGRLMVYYWCVDVGRLWLVPMAFYHYACDSSR